MQSVCLMFVARLHQVLTLKLFNENPDAVEPPGNIDRALLRKASIILSNELRQCIASVYS